VATTGLKLLAMMQGAWSVVVRHHPTIEKGDWVAYYDGSTTKQARKNMMWVGRGKVLEAGPDPKDSVTTEWYSLDPDTGVHTYERLPKEEAWHLDKKYCYRVDKGWDTRTPNYISSNPGEDAYLTIGVDDDGNKIKVTLGEILIDEEDMCPTEQYGLEFIKRNYNSKLYKAQLLQACINTIKINAWVRDYNINLARVRREHLNTFAHSKVKGFMWLFCSHELPVRTRMRGKKAGTKCPHCYEEEDIQHMAFDCTTARYIRKIVFKEWWSHTKDHAWSHNHGFKETFFFKGSDTLEVAKHTLNNIATYHIWKYQCSILYDGNEKITLAVITANNIWIEFTSAIKARLNHIKAKADWWVYRDCMQLVPKQVATQKLADIGKEQAILSSLLLEWECPRPGTALAGYIPPIAQIVPGSKHGYSLPPVFPSFDMNWKIRTTPKTKGRDTLDVPLWEVTSHSGSTSSSSGSSC
jgi:hypothetical protein